MTDLSLSGLKFEIKLLSTGIWFEEILDRNLLHWQLTLPVR